jgi:diguanylate cyclase (GGDEF)-like protein/PAS domain S-box-containing protein
MDVKDDRNAMDTANSPEDSPSDLSFRGLIEAATHVVIALFDLDGRISYVNGACRALLGYEPEEMLQRHYSEFIPSAELTRAARRFQDTTEGRPHLRRWATVRTKGGDWARLSFDMTPYRRADGRLRGVVFVAHEASGEEVAPPVAAHVEAETGRQAGLVERLPAVSYVAEPGPAGRWRYVSPQIEAMLDYSPEEWLADPNMWANCIHPDDRPRILEEEERDAGTGSTEYRLIGRDGRVVWVRDEAVLRTEPDGTQHYDGILTDITDRKRFESRLQFFAEHDPLTGVLNRRRFLEELEAEIRRLRRQPQPAALLMFDLDSLKEVNDSLGHGVGDALIRGTAEILDERLRETDTVGRLGGDEFAVLLRGASSQEAERVAQELVTAMRARGESMTGRAIASSVSAGVTDLRSTQENADAALAEADQAMYEAKGRGGGRVETYVRPPDGAVPRRSGTDSA